MPDEVGAKLDAVQVVGLVQTGVHLVVEPHLLKLLPISTWAGKMVSKACIDWEEVSTDHALHVVVEVLCTGPAVGLVGVFVSHVANKTSSPYDGF